MRDSPLFLVPRAERRKLLEKRCRPVRPRAAERGTSSSPTTSRAVSCASDAGKSTPVHAAYPGDYLKVLRHIRVERVYVSARYQAGAATMEPQLSVDVLLATGDADRTTAACPRPSTNVARSSRPSDRSPPPTGGSRIADLLQAAQQAFKYLLGTIETATVSWMTWRLHLDRSSSPRRREAADGSSATRTSPISGPSRPASELVRAPLPAPWRSEEEILRQGMTGAAVGQAHRPSRHRDGGPLGGADPPREADPRALRGDRPNMVDDMSPLEKLALRAVRLPIASASQAKELKERRGDYQEIDSYPNYEGRMGASRPRDQDRPLQRRAERLTTLPHRPGGARGARGALQGQDELSSSSSRRWSMATTTTRSSCGWPRPSSWTSSTRRCATRWAWSPRANTASSSSAT